MFQTHPRPRVLQRTPSNYPFIHPSPQQLFLVMTAAGVHPGQSWDKIKDTFIDLSESSRIQKYNGLSRQNPLLIRLVIPIKYILKESSLQLPRWHLHRARFVHPAMDALLNGPAETKRTVALWARASIWIQCKYVSFMSRQRQKVAKIPKESIPRWVQM